MWKKEMKQAQFPMLVLLVSAAMSAGTKASVHICMLNYSLFVLLMSSIKRLVIPNKVPHEITYILQCHII